MSLLTVRAYGFDLVSLIRWLKANLKTFKTLDQKEFLLFIYFLREVPLAPASINRQISTATCFYRFLYAKDPKWQHAIPVRYRRGKYSRSNFGSRFRVKDSRKLIEPLKRQEIDRLTQKLGPYRDRAIVTLMLFCGLRCMEVRGLKIKDIDFEEGSLRVIGKGNKERLLPLSPDVAASIQKYLKFQRPENTPTDHVFVVLKGKNRGSPLTAAGLRSLFRYHRKISGVTQANPHRLRHTFGIEMVRAGVKLATLQKMLGHTHIETTMRYINLSMQDLTDEYHRAITSIKTRYENL
jgi:site-specific recombinase XerD